MIDHQDAMIAAGKYDDTDMCKFCLKRASECSCTPESIARLDLKEKLKASLEAEHAHS